MIELEHLTKRYADRAAVDDLNLVVPDGEVAVLIGPSGCGKTTTLRMINRLVEPTSGRVLIDGTDTSTLPPEELRRGIGFIFQAHNLLEALTARQNVQMALGVDTGIPDDGARSRSEDALRAVGLGKHLESHPSKLSGGQRQRVAIARALVRHPKIVLADEPTGDLDEETEAEIMTFFERTNRERKVTMIMVTHSSEIALRASQRLRMKQGVLEKLN